MNTSFTFAMIKPNAVLNNHTGDIISKIENSGFGIYSMSKRILSSNEVEKLYKEHSSQPFFRDLCNYVTSHAVILLCVFKKHENENDICWKDFRKLIGATDPSEADPESIRGMFGESRRKNAIHASDSNESAKRELSLFFQNKDDNHFIHYLSHKKKFIDLATF